MLSEGADGLSSLIGPEEIARSRRSSLIHHAHSSYSGLLEPKLSPHPGGSQSK